MRKEVEEYLKQHQTREKEEIRQRRAAYLISLDLCETQYPQEGESEDDYADFEEGRRCRKVPLELTEEEYAAVCAATPPEQVRKKGWPIWPVYKILFVLAMVFYGVCAISVLFSMVGSGGYGYGFGMFFTAILGCLTYFTVGTLLLAVSEMIRLMKKRAGES